MMQHTHLRHAPLRHSHITAPSKARLLEVGLLLIALALLAPIMFPAVSRAASRIAFLPGVNQSAPATTARGPSGDLENSASRTDNLDAFEQDARALAATGSSDAFQKLVQTMKQTEPESRRAITINLLKDASPEVVPVLIAAVSDSDAGVRAGVAQVLGLRREYQAIAALETATHDPEARVRSEAAKSLGETYAWQDLARLEMLEATDGNTDVRDAAHSAAAMIKAGIAKEVGLLDFQVLDVAVIASDVPQLYAATQSDLYTRHGTTWQRVGSLPDAPLDLATGSDENSLYLATESSGLYRSADGGTTWEHLQFGLQTPTQLTVTAIAVDPQGPHRLYAALAAPGANPGKLDSLGIFTSADEGKTWVPLPYSPFQAVTTRLFVDPESPGYLYGLADDTPWRYQLPSEFCGYCTG